MRFFSHKRWALLASIAVVVGTVVAILQFVSTFVLPHGSGDRAGVAGPPDLGRPEVATSQPTSPNVGSNGNTTAELGLRNLLSTTTLPMCVPAQDLEAGVDAALRCSTVPSAPSIEVEVDLWDSPGNLALHIKNRRRNLPFAEDCRAGESGYFTWNLNNGEPSDSNDYEGDVVCDQDGSYYRMEWTYNALPLVDVIAESPSAGELFAWWSEACPAMLTVPLTTQS